MMQPMEGLEAIEVAKWSRLMALVSKPDPENHNIDTEGEFAGLWQENGSGGKASRSLTQSHQSTLSLGTGIESNWLIVAQT